MNLVPTASTTAALALGDALAMCLLVRKGFREEQFAAFHPGGKLGRKLMTVEGVMVGGDGAPRVRPSTLMPDVIHQISSKRLGHDLSSTTTAGWRASSPTASCAG
jgi:arabinose-5-phosphate isomerase